MGYKGRPPWPKGWCAESACVSHTISTFGSAFTCCIPARRVVGVGDGVIEVWIVAGVVGGWVGSPDFVNMGVREGGGGEREDEEGGKHCEGQCRHGRPCLRGRLAAVAEL
jgi:hypothetical protein